VVLALLHGLEHVAGLGDPGPVDFWPRFFLLWRGGRSASTAAALDYGTHSFCLIRLNGAGVGLFLGDTDFLQRIQNRSALDFQFTR
jgi:hypothetical protein